MLEDEFKGIPFELLTYGRSSNVEILFVSQSCDFCLIDD
ncbi:hypothetical protein STPL106120_09240 [Streptococcus pluranimalium]